MSKINMRYNSDIVEMWLREHDPDYSKNNYYLNNRRFRRVIQDWEIPSGEMDDAIVGKTQKRRHRQVSEWYRKCNKLEFFVQLAADKKIAPEGKGSKNRKELILTRLILLPEGAKQRAMTEFEIHEYFARNEGKHIKLINDTPNNTMACDLNGDWLV